MVSFSACQTGDDTGQNVESIDEIVNEAEEISETTIQSEIELTSNLTFEDINIIEINGKQASLPFKVEELVEEYSIKEEYAFNEAYLVLYNKEHGLR